MFKADPSELNFLDQFLLLDIGKNSVKSKKLYRQRINYWAKKKRGSKMTALKNPPKEEDGGDNTKFPEGKEVVLLE